VTRTDQNDSMTVPHRRRPISIEIHAAAVAIHVAGDQIRLLGKSHPLGITPVTHHDCPAVRRVAQPFHRVAVTRYCCQINAGEVATA
jgi:hypothetical protein